MSLLSKTAIRSFFLFFLVIRLSLFSFLSTFLRVYIACHVAFKKVPRFSMTHAWLRLVCEDLVRTGSSRA